MEIFLMVVGVVGVALLIGYLARCGVEFYLKKSGYIKREELKNYYNELDKRIGNDYDGFLGIMSQAYWGGIEKKSLTSRVKELEKIVEPLKKKK
jgi:hypothetical protein